MDWLEFFDLVDFIQRIWYYFKYTLFFIDNAIITVFIYYPLVGIVFIFFRLLLLVKYYYFYEIFKKFNFKNMNEFFFALWILFKTSNLFKVSFSKVVNSKYYKWSKYYYYSFMYTYDIYVYDKFLPFYRNEMFNNIYFKIIKILFYIILFIPMKINNFFLNFFFKLIDIFKVAFVTEKYNFKKPIFYWGISEWVIFFIIFFLVSVFWIIFLFFMYNIDCVIEYIYNNVLIQIVDFFVLCKKAELIQLLLISAYNIDGIWEILFMVTFYKRIQTLLGIIMTDNLAYYYYHYIYNGLFMFILWFTVYIGFVDLAEFIFVDSDYALISYKNFIFLKELFLYSKFYCYYLKPFLGFIYDIYKAITSFFY